MAITIEQQAYSKQAVGTNTQNDVQPVYTPAVFTLSSTKSAEINFRYVADVYINGFKRVRLKYSPNAVNYGIVDVTQILIDFCETQVNGYNAGVATGSSAKGNVTSNNVPHSIHQIDEYSRNNNVMIDWHVMFGEEYQLANDESPIIYEGSTDNEGEPALQSNEFQSFNSTLGQFVDLMNKNISTYILSASSSEVMSSLSYLTNRKIGRNDYHTLTVFNGTNRDNNVSRPDRMNVRTYNSAGTQLQFFQVLNTDANGGSPYGSTQDDGEKNLLFVGCGTQNFANQGNPVSANATYYTIQFVQGGVGRSRLYRFDINDCDESSQPFKQYRLGWLNKFGGFDYYTFTMKSENSFDIERQTFMQTVGTYEDTSYFFQEGDFGRSDFNVDARQKLKLQSDWLVDGEVEMMKECFMSPRVWLIETQPQGDRVFPVNVQATNFIEYKQKQDKVYQYELEVTFSHKHKVQNG